MPSDGPRGRLDAATAALFGRLSALRRRRIFHPHGVGFAATLHPFPGAPVGVQLFDGPRRALVRLSRSLGLPEALADPCGIGLRVPDAYGPRRHQDLLLVTSAAPAGLRHLVLPARGFADRPYSSLLPYDVRGGLRLVGALALSSAPGPSLAALRRGEAAGLTFRILVAPLTGGWEPVADLELETRLPDAEVENLRLDPANTGGGLRPAGRLNRLRLPAYRGSQDGRGARERGEAGLDHPVGRDAMPSPRPVDATSTRD